MMDAQQWTTPRLLVTAARLTDNAWNRHLTGQNVTHTGINTLRALATLGPVSQIELARTVRVQGPTIGKIIDRLEARGLAARTPNSADRRVIAVSLTPKGRAVLEEVAQAEEDFNNGAGLASRELRAALILIISREHLG